MKALTKIMTGVLAISAMLTSAVVALEPVDEAGAGQQIA